MKLRDPDCYIDREDMIDVLVDHIIYWFRYPDSDKEQRKADMWLVDLLTQDNWIPMLNRSDDEIQDLYDEWVGGELRLNSFYGDDQEAQLELDMESRHG